MLWRARPYATRYMFLFLAVWNVLAVIATVYCWSTGALRVLAG